MPCQTAHIKRNIERNRKVRPHIQFHPLQVCIAEAFEKGGRFRHILTTQYGNQDAAFF